VDAYPGCMPVAGTPEFRVNAIAQPHKHDVGVTVHVEKIEGRGNRDMRTVVAAHAVNRDGEGHGPPRKSVFPLRRRAFWNETLPGDLP